MKNNGKIKAAVVGVGYFGEIHCRKLSALEQVELTAVVDINPTRARQVARLYRTQWFTSHRQLDGVQAAVVAVPTSRHFEVAEELLQKGLDLLVEKPLAATPQQAERLCRLAEEKKLMLQVGQLERFNPRWAALRREVARARYIQIERSGPFCGRGGDVDVVREIMVHDLDMLRQFTQAPVSEVQARGRVLCTCFIDEAEVHLSFADGLQAQLKVSRGDSNTRRRVQVRHTKGELELDLVTGEFVRRNGRGPAKRTIIEAGDPLQQQDRLFFHALCNGRVPAVSGSEGLEAVRLASGILESLHPGDVV